MTKWNTESVLRASQGTPPVGDPIRIEAGQLHEIATQAEDALLAAEAPIFARGSDLVRPAVEEVDAAGGRRTKSAILSPVNRHTLVDHLSAAARWERFDVRGGKWKAADPPKDVAEVILSRGGLWRLRSPAGVITTQTMRPDGSVLDEPGYDSSTRLVLMSPPEMPAVPQRPSRGDATAALALLDDLIAEFPIVDTASRSVALSCLITPVVRGAMPVAPMHVVRAPTPGSGKSYLIDLAAAISTGQWCPVIAAARDEAETEKRLAAKLIAGHPLISIDNLNGELRSDALCQIIERPIVEVRVLGASKMARIEARSTVFANGNNIVLAGDLVRRVILCSLDPNVERPELRRFRSDPLSSVLANRGRYIAAALTIARAYHCAGYPDPCPPLASFEDWSRLVRSALVWLGRDDPVATMEAARAEDPELGNLRAVVTAWYGAVGTSYPMTAGELKQQAASNDDLRRALTEVSMKRGEIDAVRLGRWLGRRRNRIVNGLKISAAYDTDGKQMKWALTR